VSLAHSSRSCGSFREGRAVLFRMGLDHLWLTIRNGAGSLILVQTLQPNSSL
jgi:hypothetical protein